MFEDHNNTQASMLPNTVTKPLEFAYIRFRHAKKTPVGIIFRINSTT